MTRSNTSPAAKSPNERAPQKQDRPVQKQSVLKFASPRKAGNGVPSPKKKAPMKIACYNFFPVFSFEIYMFEKTPDDDGFTNSINRYLRDEFGDEKHNLFDACNFTESLVRRVPLSDNVDQTNAGNRYLRRVFLRYPTDGESTPETRQQGLSALKEFIMDKRFHSFVPDAIVLEDRTNYDAVPPISMDRFLHNDAIDAAIRHDIAESELNSNFNTHFPDLARVLWQGPYPSELGVELGFRAA